MRFVGTFLFVLFVTSVTAPPAAAVLQFYNVFATEYLADHPDAEFVALVKKPANKCYICHLGKKRTHRNAFGALMDEQLDVEKDKKDKEKIAAALKEAFAQHVDPNDPSSETYADRLAKSQFPAGELEELKKEPAE
jgi:hypothetical protein